MHFVNSARGGAEVTHRLCGRRRHHGRVVAQHRLLAGPRHRTRSKRHNVGTFAEVAVNNDAHDGRTVIGMMFSQVPGGAAWRHRDAREGFESVFLRADRSGYRLEGHTAAVEEGQAWAVRYVIALDEHWTTRTARVWGWSLKGEHELWLEADGSGHWEVNGRVVRELDGCLDVDLESSVCTNTIPVHRLHLGVGQSGQAPAAYVRALDLGVGRLEQQYARVDDNGTHRRYDYRCPAFDFQCRLVYDDSGLLLEYPGIASRVL